jgi:acyl-CoA thioesterase I
MGNGTWSNGKVGGDGCADETEGKKIVLRRFAVMLFSFIIWAMTASISTAQPIKIVGVGDSLMAAYQLEAAQGFPAQLQKALKDQGFDVEVADAGVSGDTTSGGLARLDWSVPDGTDLVILELGANDALRGVDPKETGANLRAMIEKLKARNITVVLAGMLAPPNMGEAYTSAFGGIFPNLSKEFGLPLIPFFLEGVAGMPELQLDDRMHPNPEGVKKMVENALPVVKEALSALSQ